MVKGAVFGSVLDLETLKIDLSPDVMIPGVAVASSRATPLAGTHHFYVFSMNHFLVPMMKFWTSLTCHNSYSIFFH